METEEGKVRHAIETKDRNIQDFQSPMPGPNWKGENIIDRKKESAERLPVELILLSDSANAVSAIAIMQPRSNDKLTCIILSYLRDIAPKAIASFCYAKNNLADSGSKNNGDRGLFYRLCEFRKFSISFTGGNY